MSARCCHPPVRAAGNFYTGKSCGAPATHVVTATSAWMQAPCDQRALCPRHAAGWAKTTSAADWSRPEPI
jgi:hypothetical protein